MTTNKSTNAVTADICLYGTNAVGIGYLARSADGRMFGTGEPVNGRSSTEAIWHAVAELRAAGITTGRVAIFATGGEIVATAPIGNVPAFGDLKWQSAEVYSISSSALEAAAQ